MSKITLVDADELVSKIVDKLQTINTTKENFGNEFEKPLSVKEMANFLGFSPNYVRRLCQQRKIPYSKLHPDQKNSPIVMYRSVIKEWIDKNKVKTLDEIRKDVDFSI